MAPQPKRRMSKARTGRRRQGHKLVLPRLAACSNCGKMKLDHTVCSECGFYDGHLVVAPKLKATITKLTPEEAKASATEKIEPK